MMGMPVYGTPQTRMPNVQPMQMSQAMPQTSQQSNQSLDPFGAL